MAIFGTKTNVSSHHALVDKYGQDPGACAQWV